MSNDENKVVLLDESGEEFEFEVLDTIEIEDERYAILLPVEDDGEGEEAVILKVGEDEDGEDILYEIEDDEEWERVASIWKESIKESGDLQ